MIVSDFHCGNIYGLTPPSHFQEKHNRDLQEEAFDSYRAMIKKWGQPDILINNGDSIDGNQSRQGGAELITTDRNVQVEMAMELLEMWKPKKLYMTYGTAYHIGSSAEDFEYQLAERLKERGVPTIIEGHLFLDIEGVTFDIRHKVATSGVFHGRATALLRELMWCLVKEANETGPKVDVVVRSHAHYHILIETPEKLAFITPALQLARGRFGSRECSGEIHWGAMRLIVDKGKVIQKDKHIWKLRANKAKIYKIK